MKIYLLLLLIILPGSFTPSRPLVHVYRDIKYIKTLTLFVKVINSESIGQSYEEKLRVGSVILNRIKDPTFPKTLSGVIFKKNQFKGINSKHFKVINSVKGRESIKAARYLLKYGSILPKDVVYFHNPKVGKDKQWMNKIKHKLYLKGDGHWYFKQ